MNKIITVLGAGHFGISLASVLAKNASKVIVWARREEEASKINNEHKSKYFNDLILDEKIEASSDIEYCLSVSSHVVIATPVSAISSLLPYMRKYNNNKYLLTCKGLYNGDIITKYIEGECPNIKIAALSGPSFSTEIAQNKITAVVIASTDLDLAKEFQVFFHTKFFRPYTSTDIIGVELCGAVKNVYAIASGMVDRRYNSSNSKTALLTRSFAEMRRLIDSYGGKPETLLGLAGVGDLMLTCHSLTSRNYSFGYNYNGSLETESTTEGINATKEFFILAKNNNVEMPIVNALYKVLFEGVDFVDAIMHLLERELKNEG